MVVKADFLSPQALLFQVFPGRICFFFSMVNIYLWFSLSLPSCLSFFLKKSLFILFAASDLSSEVF